MPKVIKHSPQLKNVTVVIARGSKEQGNPTPIKL